MRPVAGEVSTNLMSGPHVTWYPRVGVLAMELGPPFGETRLVWRRIARLGARELLEIACESKSGSDRGEGAGKEKEGRSDLGSSSGVVKFTTGGFGVIAVESSYLVSLLVGPTRVP